MAKSLAVKVEGNFWLWVVGKLSAVMILKMNGIFCTFALCFTSSRFHQHFIPAIFDQKCFAQLFSNYSLPL